MRAVRWVGAILLVGAGASACAPATGPGAAAPAGPEAPPRAAPAPVAAAPAPAPPPSARERLAQGHRDEALRLERLGHLRRGLDEWKIALAVMPDDPVATEGRRRLEDRIARTAAARIAEARAALARGSHPEARRRLLSALAVDPANATAFEMLRVEVREVEFVVHKVVAGDTLASLAQRYYNDRARAEVIAETNHLAPSARLAVGKTVKIPEIPGLPFQRPIPRREAASAPRPEAAPAARPEAAPDPAPAPAEGAGPTPPKEDPYAVNPMLAEAREAMERREYAVALADVDRFLASSPGHPDGLAVKKDALYQQGKVQLERRQYDDSYRTLTQLARLAPDYADSAALLRQARGRLIEHHYAEGIRLYREEKLDEAVGAWRRVLELDPQHANARKNIQQAERLLQGLEQRRRR